jgi:hypothetical protein
MSDREHLYSYHYKGTNYAFGFKAASRAEAEAGIKRWLGRDTSEPKMMSSRR